MTIKSFMSSNPGIVYTSLQDAYGGQDIKIHVGPELEQLVNWWRLWSPVLTSSDPSVRDLLNQAMTMQALVNPDARS
jgi:hypothetical protein